MCTFFLVVAFHDARFLSGLYHRFSYIVEKLCATPCRVVPFADAASTPGLHLDCYSSRDYLTSKNSGLTAIGLAVVCSLTVAAEQRITWVKTHKVPGRPLGWFHVPKTSTGFGASVAMANCNISGCGHEGPDYWHAACNHSGTQQSGMWLSRLASVEGDWHPPLNVGVLAHWRGRLVGMLRSPAEWKRSYFQDKLLNSHKYFPTPAMSDQNVDP